MSEAALTLASEEIPASDTIETVQYLTFIIAKESYGIRIDHVCEIICAQRFTVVPDPRPFIKGVINLRGTIIPVMDVRTRLAMEPREADGRTCIIVVAVDQTQVGLLVDTVSEVIEVASGSLQHAPHRASVGSGESIALGLINQDDGVRIVVDTRRLLFGGSATSRVDEDQP